MNTTEIVVLSSFLTAVVVVACLLPLYRPHWTDHLYPAEPCPPPKPAPLPPGKSLSMATAGRPDDSAQCESPAKEIAPPMSAKLRKALESISSTQDSAKAEAKTKNNLLSIELLGGWADGMRLQIKAEAKDRVEAVDHQLGRINHYEPAGLLTRQGMAIYKVISRPNPITQG